jgi:hypothetical protein
MSQYKDKHMKPSCKETSNLVRTLMTHKIHKMTQSPKYRLGYDRYFLALWSQGNWSTQNPAEELTQTSGMVHEANYTTSTQPVCHRIKRDSLRRTDTLPKYTRLTIDM